MMPQAMLVKAFPVEAMSGFATGAAEVLLAHEIAVAQHQQPAVGRGALADFAGILQAREIEPSLGANVAAIMQCAPAAFAVRRRKIFVRANGRHDEQDRGEKNEKAWHDSMAISNAWDEPLIDANERS
jgi:hypothetical protein